MPVPVQERRLPITQTDLRFLEDSLEESRQDYETTVKEIADRCGLSSTNYLSSYRSLRQKELKEEDQAVSVTDGVTARKINIDVEDFKEGDLCVKAVGQSTVVVEGCVERPDEGGTSTHSFRRRFSLPELARIEDITSTLFSDGVLAITAPKIANDAESSVTGQTGNFEINRTLSDDEMPALISPQFDIVYVDPEAQPEVLSIRRSHGNGNSFAETRKISRSFCEEDPADEARLINVSEDDTHYKLVLDVQDFKDGDVQVKGVGKSLVVEGQVEKSQDDSVFIHTFQRRFSLPTHVNINDIAPILSSEGILTVLVEKNLRIQEMEH